MNKLAIRFTIIAVPILLSLYLLYPTLVWYRLPAQERQNREFNKDSLLGKILNLGLDLRGGSHLVLELDTDKLIDKKGDHKTAVTDALDRAIEIIRNRIDQFGVAEPLIARQGEKWIVVQLPGIKDPERAKELIGKTALLEFRLVDDSGALSKLTSALGDKRMSMTQYLDLQQKGQMPKDLARLIPEGYEVLLGRESRYVVVRSSPELTGSTLVDARVELGGQFGYPT